MDTIKDLNEMRRAFLTVLNLHQIRRNISKKKKNQLEGQSSKYMASTAQNGKSNEKQEKKEKLSRTVQIKET
jgi:hypothetical protein